MNAESKKVIHPDTSVNIGVQSITRGEIYRLHLLPGIPLVVVFGIFAALLVPLNIPNLFALMIATLFVEVPLLWAIMIRYGKREFGTEFKITKLFPWRNPVPFWHYLVIGIPLILLSMIIAMGFTPAISNILLDALFGWVPDWFIFSQDPSMFSALSQELRIIMWVGGLLVMAILGGATQELYFRGFLLPRMAHLGHASVPLNAGLFAMFHMTSPWSWPGFALMAWPWAGAANWKKSIAFPIFLHVGMLFIQWLMMSLLLFGLISMPQMGG